MVIVFAFAWLLTLAALLAACHKIEVLQERERVRRSSDHALCVNLLMTAISKRHAAQVLRYHAEKYDSVSEKTTHARLAREDYMPGGSSMPVIWMRHYADLLDPPISDDHDEHEHTYGGECIR